jgi:hypothetical protein
MEENLLAFEEKYTPFEDGLETLRRRIAPEGLERLTECHRTRIRELFRTDLFVGEVRSAMSAFDTGIREVNEGKLSVEELGLLHQEIVDVYRIP